MAKLKPVVFVQGKYAYNGDNKTQQIMLLKALQITQDTAGIGQFGCLGKSSD